MNRLKIVKKIGDRLVERSTWLQAGAMLCALQVSNVVLAGNTFTSPLKETSLVCFLIAILNSLIYILFPIIVLMIVYTGFLFVAAQGNESKLSEARRALMWTVIGGLVVLGSVALALAIKATVDNFLVEDGELPACSTPPPAP